MNLLAAIVEWINTRFGRGGNVAARFEPWSITTNQDPVWMSPQHCAAAQTMVSSRRTLDRSWDWDRSAMHAPGYLGQTWSVGPGDAVNAHRLATSRFAELTSPALANQTRVR